MSQYGLPFVMSYLVIWVSKLCPEWDHLKQLKSMNNKISICPFVIRRICRWDFPWSLLLHLVIYWNVSLSPDEILIAGRVKLLVRGLLETSDRNTWSVFLKVEIGQLLKLWIFMWTHLNNFDPVAQMVVSLNVSMLMVDLGTASLIKKD